MSANKPDYRFMKSGFHTLIEPEKPDPNECCGSGCVPCIYDYYYERLDRWEELNAITLTKYLTLPKDSKIASK